MNLFGLITTVKNTVKILLPVKIFKQSKTFHERIKSPKAKDHPNKTESDAKQNEEFKITNWLVISDNRFMSGHCGR